MKNNIFILLLVLCVGCATRNQKNVTDFPNYYKMQGSSQWKKVEEVSFSKYQEMKKRGEVVKEEVSGKICYFKVQRSEETFMGNIYRFYQYKTTIPGRD